MSKPVKDYFQKLIVNLLFSKRGYKKIKFYKNYYKYLAGIKYEVSEFFEKVLRQDDIYFDIGFNCGQYVLRLNRTFHSRLNIYGFEPVKENFVFVKGKINNDKIHLYNTAVNSRAGEVKLYIPVLNSIEIDTQASLDYENRKEYYDEFSVRTVDSITLDDFCSEKGIKKIDLIKIDTEGNDSEVIKGAWNTINEFKPLIAAEDLNNDTEINLENIGYKKYYLFKKDKSRLTLVRSEDSIDDVVLHIHKNNLDKIIKSGYNII